MSYNKKKKNDDGKVILKGIITAFMLGVAAANYHRIKTKAKIDASIVPRLDRTESGRVGKLERFSHYVARQLGFSDPNECPQLCKLAYDYLRKSKDCENNIYEYFANEAEAESLYVKLIEEFDRCILSYFAFHWSQVSAMITQVINDQSEKKPKLRDFVMAATRKQRFDRVTKDLKVTRVFSTLVEEMKAISKGDSQTSHLMVPVALCERSPVLLLMGGGMGAGKSTVIKDILKESFWSGTVPVIVEADAFKESDVIYKAISAMGHHDDMLQTAELVHQSSTDAASSLLVTALNEGRDVILDGTLSWEPYVEQTITMARNVHKHRYRMGVGYKVHQNGTITENYWEREEAETQKLGVNGEMKQRKPYRIEMVGVVCDAYLAVVRGIRRAIMTKRAVRVSSQLDSHKRFANAFTKYCLLVDSARLYCTNSVGGSHKLIARKDGDSKLLIDAEEYKCLTNVGSLNSEAESIYELYEDPSLIYDPGSIWKHIVLSPSRPSIKSELKTSIQTIEMSISQKQHGWNSN